MYHIFDTYPQIYYNSTDLGYRADIELFRNLAIPDTQETFWDQTLPTFRGKVSAVRILICGNTGVGKSTIINRVFGVALVCLQACYALWYNLTDLATCFVDPRK